MTSRTETCREPLLPVIARRLSVVPELERCVVRCCETTGRKSSAAVMAMLFLMMALMIAQTLILRDTYQIILHERDVASELDR